MGGEGLSGKVLAIKSIEDEAIELGGNAVVGVEIIYKVFGSHNDMMMLLVGVKGTAVVLDETKYRHLEKNLIH